jgi:hypothetical protein
MPLTGRAPAERRQGDIVAHFRRRLRWTAALGGAEQGMRSGALIAFGGCRGLP